MNDNGLPEGIEIRRDFEEERLNPPYTYYKIYVEGEEVAVASYRLFNNQNPYWYIDEFIIFEQYRENGYGTYLLKYIIQNMWSKQRLPIHIYPTELQISKEKFIAWLVDRGFQIKPDRNTGHVFCILYPKDEGQV
ncbi:GNAT family N-acetyltransferase [Nostoc muscorum FACHB-395]|nr:GNAT family N-acetyltransferase [Desmonostoc muscorum FACHB-395]